jgi:hypothetical protein
VYLTNKNEEGLLYLNAVDEFVREPDIIRQHKLAFNIVDNFIRVGSKQEVNVDNYARDSVMELLEAADREKLLALHTFDPVTKIIFRELKDDPFARYVRTNMFEKFIRSKGEEFLKEIALDLRIAGIRNAVLFQPKDFDSPCITDRDIQFMFKLIETPSEWTCIYDKPDHQSFVTKTTYSIGSLKGLKMTKNVGYLPCDFATACELEKNDTFRHKLDFQAREILGNHLIVAGDNNNYPYTMSCQRYTLDPAPLLTRRSFDTICMLGVDTERNCSFNIGKTSTFYSSKLPQSAQKCIASQLLYAYTFYKVSETRTRYVQIVYTNIHLPDIADHLFNSIAKTRCKNHHKAYLSIIANKDEFYRTKDEMMLALEKDFSERYLPTKDSVKTWTFL